MLKTISLQQLLPRFFFVNWNKNFWKKLTCQKKKAQKGKKCLLHSWSTRKNSWTTLKMPTGHTNLFCCFPATVTNRGTVRKFRKMWICCKPIRGDHATHVDQSNISWWPLNHVSIWLVQRGEQRLLFLECSTNDYSPWKIINCVTFFIIDERYIFDLQYLSFTKFSLWECFYIPNYIDFLNFSNTQFVFHLIIH